MIHLHELKPLKLYNGNNKLIIPLSKNSKRKGSAIFLMTPNYMSSIEMIGHPSLYSRIDWFYSYYMEKSINAVLSESTNTIDHFEEDVIMEAKLKTSARKKLKDSDFGIPSKRKYPLNDEDHVRAAIRMFNHCEKEDEKELAENIIKKIKEYKMTNLEVSEENRFYKYYHAVDEFYQEVHDNVTGERVICISKNDTEKLKKRMLKMTHDLEKRISGKTFTELGSISNLEYIILYEDNHTFDGYIVIHKEGTKAVGYCNVDSNNQDIVKDIMSKMLKMMQNVLFYNESNNPIYDNGVEMINKGDKTKYNVNTIYGSLLNIFKRHSIDDITKMKYFVKPYKYDKIFNIEKVFKFKAPTVGNLVTENYVRFDNNQVMIMDTLNESSASSGYLRRILYNERMKSNNEIIDIYRMMKQSTNKIRFTKLALSQYKGNNLYIDNWYYNESFNHKNTYTLDKGVNVYNDFLSRILNPSKYEIYGYNRFTVFLPVYSWSAPDNFTSYTEDINPISTIIRLVKSKGTKALGDWKNLEFVFFGRNGYFKATPGELDRVTIHKFESNIKKLAANAPIESDELAADSTDAITTQIIDNLDNLLPTKLYAVGNTNEKFTKPKVTLVTPEDVRKKAKEDQKTKKEEELVKEIEKIAETSKSTKDAVEEMNNDEKIKEIVADIQSEESDGLDFSVARRSRIVNLQNSFQEKEIRGKKVGDLIAESQEVGDKEELPSRSIAVNSINKDQWDNIKFINFNSEYNIDQDIAAILDFFATRSVPIAIRNIDIQDTSTTEDFIDTWRVQAESINGDRFTLVFDIPKFIDNRMLRLGGNDKILNGQLMNLPIIKTDNTVCQITTNYNKIFFYLYGTSLGKSNVAADIIIKTLSKYNGNKIKVKLGSNTLTSIKYEVPLDYKDIGSTYSSISINGNTINFDQDYIIHTYANKIDYSKGLPVGVDSKGNILYYDSTKYLTFSHYLYSMLKEDTEFANICNNTKVSVKYTYTRASILNTDIPVILICCYCEGLTESLKKANVEYTIEDKRRQYNKFEEDVIKFSDGYLYYKVNYSSSIIMNGLKDCDTESYSIKDINSRSMWINMLDDFGGRIKADGLDNFYDLMMDPLTIRTCQAYKLPTDFCSALIYASNLMCDTKYNRHTDITGNRLRVNEIIAGYTYKELAKSYASYRITLKKTNNTTMSIKKTAIVDAILLDPTSADASTINDLNYAESYNTFSFKGLSGLNSERSYSLDKRSYDDSMVGVLGMSTGFAGTVGINRQGVVDPNILGKRGYIKSGDGNEDIYKDVNILTISESLTPLSTTHDDPFREAMSNTQRTKHDMRVAGGDPLLITNGMDDAITRFTPNYFSFTAKEDGKVLERDEKHILIQYKSGDVDYINLNKIVYKNSDGGFYTAIKLIPNQDLKTTFKMGDVLAYDPESYTQNFGYDNNCTYNQGTIAKVAVLTTDEGFEDSCVIDSYLSKALSSDVVVQTPINLDAQTNIFGLIKVGSHVNEGDNLLIIQNSFEDKDVNILLKNLVDDEEEITNIGRVPIKSHCTGTVEDIKVYRTVELDQLSDSLRTLCEKYEKEKSAPYKSLSKYNKEKANKYAVQHKHNMTGKLKNVNGVLIEIYISYKDDFSIGDKLIFLGAQKGVSKDVFEPEDTPTSDYRPNEPINALASMRSFDARMITTPIQYGLAYKFLIELDRQVKDIMSIKQDYTIMHTDLNEK